MLPANREDILQKSDWNQALISAAIDLFVAAVRAYNATGLLKYTWIKFVKSQGPATGTIFGSFFTKLLERLRNEPVLESRARSYQLQSVPAVFTDGANPPKPLIMKAPGPKVYTSPLYAEGLLRELGVNNLNGYEFCALLERYARTYPTKFSSKSSAWHARVAAAILQVGVHKVRDIALLPLGSGQWIRSNDGPFYFPEIQGALRVPSGIEIDLLDEQACMNSTRRRLFSELGARPLDAASVFDLILRQHRSKDGSASRWTLEQLLGHAWFLFDAPSRPTQYDLSSFLMKGARFPGHSPGKLLYMDRPGAHIKASEVFGKDCGVVDFVHPRYFESVPTQRLPDWYNWLEKDVKVNVLPRMWDTPHDTVTREFAWLVDQRPSSVWLALLQENFDHYVPLLKLRSVTAYLGTVLVDCVGGSRRPLHQVYLRSAVKGEPGAEGYVPVLEADSDDDARWTALSVTGLKTSLDLQFYLTVLKSIRSTAISGSTADEVKRLYVAIQEHSRAQPESIKCVSVK